MPKTKHTATAPNGQTFKRTSQSRVYSHVVLGRRCRDEAMRRANAPDARVQDGRNWDYYARNAAGKATYSAYVLSGSPEFVAKMKARDIESGKEFLAKHPDRAAYIAQQHAERLANVEDTNFDLWHDLGWASRTDLAQKNASSHASKPYWAEAIIVEAVIA